MKAYQIVYEVTLQGFEKVYGSKIYTKYDDAYSTLLKISQDDLEEYPHEIWIKELELVE